MGVFLGNVVNPFSRENEMVTVWQGFEISSVASVTMSQGFEVSKLWKV